MIASRCARCGTPTMPSSSSSMSSRRSTGGLVTSTPIGGCEPGSPMERMPSNEDRTRCAGNPSNEEMTRCGCCGRANGILSMSPADKLSLKSSRAVCYASGDRNTAHRALIRIRSEPDRICIDCPHPGFKQRSPLVSLTAALPDKAKLLAGTRVDGASAELALPREGEKQDHVQHPTHSHQLSLSTRGEPKARRLRSPHPVPWWSRR